MAARTRVAKRGRNVESGLWPQRRRDLIAHPTFLHLGTGCGYRNPCGPQDINPFTVSSDPWLWKAISITMRQLSQPPKDSSYLDNPRVFIPTCHIEDLLFYLLSFLLRHLRFSTGVAQGQATASQRGLQTEIPIPTQPPSPPSPHCFERNHFS